MKKTTVIQLAAFAAAVVLSLIAISYARGDFDFSFVSRPEKTSSDSTQSFSFSSYSWSADLPKAEEERLTYSAFLASLPRYSALADAGYSVSTESWGDGFCLALVEDSLSLPLPKIYSLGSYDKRVVVTENAAGGGYTSTVSSESVTQPVIRNYLGYLLVDTGESTAIYSASGALIRAELEPFEPAYLTDKSGTPIFTRSGHYYVLNAKGSFVSAGVDEDLAEVTPAMTSLSLSSGYKGISRYSETVEVDVVVNREEIEEVTKKMQKAMLDGASAEDAAAAYPLPEPIPGKEERELWGYRNSSGSIDIPPQYYTAYNFNQNGLAAVADEEGKIYLINIDGEVVLNPHETELKIAGVNRPVFDGWYLPDTYGEEVAGMFSFDNGLMLIRRKLIDKVDEQYGLIHVSTDSLALIYEDGSYFPIPEGYRLVSYSEGILLLERDGLYGFMNKQGRWIADPEYVSATPFSEGLAVLEKKDGTFGMISTSGDRVLEFVYNYITPCTGGVCAAMTAQYGWTIMYKMAK